MDKKIDESDLFDAASIEAKKQFPRPSHDTSTVALFGGIAAFSASFVYELLFGQSDYEGSVTLRCSVVGVIFAGICFAVSWNSWRLYHQHFWQIYLRLKRERENP